MDVITAGSSSVGIPFHDAAAISQILYLSSELGAKGTITKIAHRLDIDPVDGSYGSFTVKLANTDITTLGTPTTNFATNISGGSTVYIGTYLISSSSGLKAGDWIEIPLATPFVIDPTKNLLVEMSNSSGDFINPIRWELNNTRYINRFGNAVPPAATGPTQNYLAALRLIMQ